MARGIDYGMGQTNIDKETGIRYGVISMNHERLSEWAWDSLEADYGEPSCPKCGNEVTDYDKMTPDDGEYEPYSHACCDYVCENCRIILGSDQVTGDEPVGHTLNEEGYEGFVDSYGDLMITKSPYFTYASFCSPCAPGAGHLASPCSTGVRTYCLDKTWFRDNHAPYPVYEVPTGKYMISERSKKLLLELEATLGVNGIADTVTWQVVADSFEEDGDQNAADCLRWQATNNKRAYPDDVDAKWCFYCDNEFWKSDPNSNLPPELFLCFDPEKVEVRIDRRPNSTYIIFSSFVESEEELFEAWRKLHEEEVE